MEELKNIITETLTIIKSVGATAREVNRKSIERKDITKNSATIMERLIKTNAKLKTNFDKVNRNLENSLNGINSNSTEVNRNISILTSVTDSLNKIKSDFSHIEEEIIELRKIVNEIKKDTDSIFSLALNASIVSSKYTSTSGVFDVLANKLNEMSNFINQNLEIIIKVVKPITEGIQKLILANDSVIQEISKGYSNYVDMPKILEKQTASIESLITQAADSIKLIEEQSKNLGDISNMITQMLSDAEGSINGSANVYTFSDNLATEVSKLLKNDTLDQSFEKQIANLSEKSGTVTETASRVNSKSKNQFDFSKDCLKFVEAIIKEDRSIRDTAEHFSKESISNNSVSDQISNTLSVITKQFSEVEENLRDSGKTIQKFNEDYKQIDNIIEFLKNILKSMHLIGMYSRIESARDEEKFSGFINISANITKLQKKIQNNIPVIEKNINDTHQLIDSVNNGFKKISADFYNISESSDKIIQQLGDIISISSNTEELSEEILKNSHDIGSLLGTLKDNINKLPEIVKVPIDGSAANMERGKQLEIKFKSVITKLNEVEVKAAS